MHLKQSLNYVSVVALSRGDEVMHRQLKIALAQVEGQAAPAENLEHGRRIVTRAAECGANLVVFPEMFMANMTTSLDPITVAESLQGPFVNTLESLASKHAIYIVAGVWEKVPAAKRVANTAVVISPDKGCLAGYRKLHLFDALGTRESDRMLPGGQLPPVVEIRGFKVGLAICYDLRFPEPFRYLVGKGADLVIVPAAWYAGPFKEEHWQTLLKARAIENTLYIAGANLTGTSFCGRSAVYDPFGVQIAAAGETPGSVYADLSLERIATVRTKLPCLGHIRKDLFQ
jgi:predicted amidohydrolase